MISAVLWREAGATTRSVGNVAAQMIPQPLFQIADAVKPVRYCLEQIQIGSRRLLRIAKLAQLLPHLIRSDLVQLI